MPLRAVCATAYILMNRKLRVAVLFGGKSAEHEISLVSARNIIAGLDPERYDVTPIGIDRNGRWLTAESAAQLLNQNGKLLALNEAAGRALSMQPGAERALVASDASDASVALPAVDVVFPALHGPYGEDGSMQGLLKLLNLPFVGPGVLGSAVGMDKDVMKRLLRDAGLPIGAFRVLQRRDAAGISFDALSAELGLPLYVKPANLGSSVGVSRVKTQNEFTRAIDEAFLYDNKLVLEKNIPGREIEVAVLGNESPLASIPGEIIPKDGFYSYESKYLDEKGAALEIPAKLDAATVARVQALAIQTYECLCLEGLSRVDLFLTASGELFVNEVNTIPGFTSISMYPKLWEASGLSYGKLLDRLIELAIERHARDQRLRTTVGD